MNFNKLNITKSLVLKNLAVLLFLLLFFEGFSRVIITRRDFSNLGIFELIQKITFYVRVKSPYFSVIPKKASCIKGLIHDEKSSRFSFEENNALLNSLKNKYEEGFKEFIKLAKRTSGKNVFVLYLPSSRNFDQNSRFFKNISDKYQVKFINLSSLLRSSGSYEEWSLHPENGHLSRYGNQKISDFLFNEFLDLSQNYKNIRKVKEFKPKPKGGLPVNRNYIANDINSMVYRVKTNSMGFRNKEEFKSNPLLVSFGDSFTFSPYLPNHDSYPILLQKKFRRSKIKNLKESIVVNAANNGTTIFHQLDILKQITPLKPHIITLQVLDNDIYNASSSYLRLANIKLQNKQLFKESLEEKDAFKKC